MHIQEKQTDFSNNNKPGYFKQKNQNTWKYVT